MIRPLLGRAFAIAAGLALTIAALSLGADWLFLHPNTNNTSPSGAPAALGAAAAAIGLAAAHLIRRLLGRPPAAQDAEEGESDAIDHP